MKLKTLNRLCLVMLGLNLAAIISIATEFLFITQHIIKYKESYQLLTRLPRAPQSPSNAFWGSAILCILFISLIVLRRQIAKRRSTINIFLALEFLLAILIFYSIKMNYNGIFLLVFADFFLTNSDLPTIFHYRFWIAYGIVLVVIFALSSFSIVGSLFSMPNISTYIDFLPLKLQASLTIYNNILSAINLILFITISLGYSLFISNREHQIKLQLKQISKSNRELKNYAALSEKIAQDRERKRIARDIHDTVGHALTGIAAGIDAVLVLIDIDPQQAKEQLKKVSLAVKQGLKDIRKTLNKIRPDALENYTLESSLRKMLKEYSSLSHVRINFLYKWGDVDFEKTTELVIFRVVEESVTNALRHGHASVIDIKCSSDDHNYKLTISNNGSTVKKITPGYGITQMKERAAIINAKLHVSGKPIFTISLTIPKRS